MDSAVTVFSRQGLFAQRIKARDIPSREHARKLWPFVIANDNHKPVTYVSPSFDSNGKLKQRSHFRTLNNSRSINIAQIFTEEEQQRQKGVSESDEHKEAKKVLLAEMQNRLSSNRGLPWSFKDPSASDFHFEGNLLLGADKIIDEHYVQTPFGMGFRLDLAVLASPLRNDEIILGGIEIERTHTFEGRKALLGKSLGFPLISIDISEMTLDEITPTWAANVLSQTTVTKEISHRQTYVYIHDLVYPLFAQIPGSIGDEKHQYLVFAADQVLNNLVKWINKLAELLEYPKNSVTPSIVNGINDATKKALNRAGEVVGSDWQRFNNQKCLRLTLPRSTGLKDLKAHKFHIVLAYLLLNKTDSLVGYKYCNGIDNDEIKEDIWIKKIWKKDYNPPTFFEHRILPKRLAEPINQMLSVINTIQSN